jgi:hypothetical protein
MPPAATASGEGQPGGAPQSWPSHCQTPLGAHWQLALELDGPPSHELAKKPGQNWFGANQGPHGWPSMTTIASGQLQGAAPQSGPSHCQTPFDPHWQLPEGPVQNMFEGKLHDWPATTALWSGQVGGGGGGQLQVGPE